MVVIATCWKVPLCSSWRQRATALLQLRQQPDGRNSWSPSSYPLPRPHSYHTTRCHKRTKIIPGNHCLSTRNFTNTVATTIAVFAPMHERVKTPPGSSLSCGELIPQSNHYTKVMLCCSFYHHHPSNVFRGHTAVATQWSVVWLSLHAALTLTPRQSWMAPSSSLSHQLPRYMTGRRTKQ